MTPLTPPGGSGAGGTRGPGGTVTPGGARAHPNDHRILRRLASGIVAHPILVLVVWLVAIGACLPFALRLPDVLDQQGSSKIVPGSAGERAAGRLVRAFPQHSERETLVVINADEIDTPGVRNLLADLDTSITPLVRDGVAVRTTSAYTIHRDATLTAIREILAPDGVPAASPDGATARLAAARSAGLVPSGLVPVLERAARTAAEQWPRIAADNARASSWADFPLPVDTSAVISAEGTVALVSVGYSGRGPDPDLEALRDLVAEAVSGQGSATSVKTAVTGELALIKDTYDRAEADNAKMERAAYLVIIVILLLFFRAVTPAALTLVLIGLAMTVSQAWLYVVGSWVGLTQFTSTIMTFVMLGAGVDYSMLLSSRYRQERLAGHSPRDAVVGATVHAGESIVLAGAAVVLAFGATLLSPVDWIPPLGYGGLAAIPVMLLAAVTITPALLVLLGDRFFWLGVRPLADLESRGWLTALLRRLATLSRRTPLGVVSVFAVATVPFLWLIAANPMTSDPVALSPDTDARRGYQLVADHWSPGVLQPTVVIGSITTGADGDPTPDAHARLASLAGQIARVPGVESVQGLTRPAGTPVTPDQSRALPPDVRREFLADDGTFRFAVTLAGDPLSDGARRAADRVGAVVAAGPVRDAVVGGATIVDREYDAALVSSFWKMVAAVCVGVFLLLLVALRSLLVPLRLIATIMLSNVWAVGTTFLVFAIWRSEPVINDLPIFLVILMMGLGMDYEIFLITRVRDLVRSGASDAAAVSAAIVDTGRVITAAGLVMAGTLGTMMLSGTLMLQQYGLGLGTAVLLDATLIRLVLAPAAILLAGKYNWWLPAFGRRRAASSRVAEDPRPTVMPPRSRRQAEQTPDGAGRRHSRTKSQS